METGQIMPREIFGSKLGLVLGPAGKDTVRYVIVYRVKPVKEMMVRYGVAHKNCTKEHITKKGSIIIIKIDSGLFGLDKSGMLRQGDLDALKMSVPLKFDGFRGIELVNSGKYRVWMPDWEKKAWVPITPKGKEHTFYPFKDALLPMPAEILHDGEAILVPAEEAITYMQSWLKRMQGKKVVVDAPEASGTMGVQAVTR